MAADVAPLFEPLAIKSYTVRNRIVMPPMVSVRHIVGEDGISWYAEHAAGVGLVIVEATGIPRFGDDLTVEALRPLTDAIHEAGALAAIQLFPVVFGTDVTCNGVTTQQIDEIVAQYEHAARTCADGGFDGVEPHGAHGYLINQFFSPAKNERDDDYGGAIENRMRFGLEIARACRRGLGDARLLLYRHTPVEKDAYGIDESLAFCRELVNAGVDVLDISPSGEAPGENAAPFRALGVPVIAVNAMDEVDRALEALNEGRADLVAVARGLIADPLWPQKVRDGRLDDIIRCTRCNEFCFGNLREGKPIACTQWPGA